MNDDQDIRTALTAEPPKYRPATSSIELRQIAEHRRRRRWTSRSLLVAAATAAILAAGWNGYARLVTNAPSASSVDDNGPVLVHAPTPSNLAAAMSTEFPVVLREGCLEQSVNVLVWPEDAKWDAKEQTITFTSDPHGKVSIRVGEPPPVMLSAGQLPLEIAARYLDDETLDRAKTCLGEGTDVTFVF
jgi:hypothetical protein